MKSSEMSFDVVVVGGGLAGLGCANRCAEQGLKVALLERGADERYHCNSRFSMGFVNCAFEYILGAPADLRAAIDRITRGAAVPELAEAFANNGGPAVRWLEKQGVRLIKGGWQGGQRVMLAPPVPNRMGLNWPGRGGDTMVFRLGAKLVERGGTLLRGVAARELIVQNKRCTGVVATRGEETLHINARAVLLADGGFQANLDLLKRFISPAPERLLQRNAKTGRGDGLMMAEAVGALLRGTDRFYGHVQSINAIENPLLWPYPVVDHPMCAGLTVNATGKRFANEGLGGVFMANAIAAQEDPQGTVAIFDQRIWETAGKEGARPANSLLEKGGATIHRSDNLQDLAKLAGLPADLLQATVSAHNVAVETGKFEALDPPRSNNAVNPAQAIMVPPFFAVPLCAGVTYTMGGVAIDGQCRVQHKEGGVIEGLYAAGSTTGGHEGGPVAGYTGGLGKATTFGYHSGNCIGAALLR
ncbi:MAG: FAD-dependent oxidoreductase [Burkholderiales bacterium]